MEESSCWMSGILTDCDQDILIKGDPPLEVGLKNSEIDSSGLSNCQRE
jgi:hypothetical protein